MATSAHQTSRALSVASLGARAIPMLAPMVALTTSSMNGWLRLAVRRSATDAA